MDNGLALNRDVFVSANAAHAETSDDGSLSISDERFKTMKHEYISNMRRDRLDC